MRTRRRRKLDVVLIAGGLLGTGLVAGAGAVGGDTERVADYWVAAKVDGDGRAQVTEVIDYDFGGLHRRGIFLDVADLSPRADIAVSSPTAPDDIHVEPRAVGGRAGTHIRIGDPDVEITGRHRYRVAYPLDVRMGDRAISWNAVGTHWEVEISQAEIHVTGPWEWVGVACSQGETDAKGGCEAEQPEPGHLVVHPGHLDPGTGVTVSARLGRRLERAPMVVEPSGGVADPGTGIGAPAGLAAAAALVAAVPLSRVIRRAGRERIAAGGAADAAWGSGSSGGERLVDHEELASLATTEFAPPEGITPAQGGIILREGVDDDDKVAWLIGAAIDGYVELEEDGKEVVLRRTGRGTGPTADLLAPAFAGRDQITLGSYDPAFEKTWDAVGTELAAWKRSASLWDPAGDRRRTIARVAGAVALVVGAAAAAGGGALSNRWGPGWLVLVGLGAVAAGGGWTALVRSWELKVRTPEGTAAWLRVESFRRFLAGSEAYHAQQAAERGVLREYTAWAVAVGEVDHWSRAVRAAGIAPQAAGASYAYVAPALARAASSSATAPSSSSGGGGGGVGGGSGGSGGGSW